MPWAGITWDCFLPDLERQNYCSVQTWMRRGVWRLLQQGFYSIQRCTRWARNLYEGEPSVCAFLTDITATRQVDFISALLTGLVDGVLLCDLRKGSRSPVERGRGGHTPNEA